MELSDMLYIPNFKKKIISLLKLLDQGYKVNKWTREYFWLSRGTTKMQKWQKAGYAMYWFQAKPTTGEAYVAECTMDINRAHDKMAHMGKDIFQKTMAWYGIKLMGKMVPCDACLRAKAQAKNTKKLTEQMATTAREWLYLDTMGPVEPSLGRSCYYMKIVDQFLWKSWDGHMKSKDQIYNLLKTCLDILQSKGITVKYLQYDNAGKQGGRLAELCWACRITMEYTVPNILQQNGIM